MNVRTASFADDYQWWCGHGAAAEIIDPHTLAIVRFEPTSRRWHLGSAMDCIFAHGDAIAIVPLIEVQTTMLIEPEASPFIWPLAIARAVPNERLAAIESETLPWLRSISLARQINDERIKRFGASDEVWALFERARTRGWLGAAPYTQAFADLAPFVYALRFARGRTVAIADAGGAAGAAYLTHNGAHRVDAVLGDAQVTRDAARWFARPYGDALPEKAALLAGDAATVSAPVHVVLDRVPDGYREIPVVRPMPRDLCVSFDPDDGPVVRSFGVRVTSHAQPRQIVGSSEHVPLGGSAGRIAVVVREDGLLTDDADTDEARALTARLNREGFLATLTTASQLDPAQHDLVHVVGLLRPEHVKTKLEACKAAGLPVVLAPSLTDVHGLGVWGDRITTMMQQRVLDRALLEDFFDHLAARRLEADGADPRGQEPFAGWGTQVAEVLELADVLIVGSAQEEHHYRTKFNWRGRAQLGGPSVDHGPIPQPMDDLVGTGDFLLMHAPLESRSNQLLALHAVRRLGLPVVVAGPIMDANYYVMLRDAAGDATMFLPKPTPAQIAALYRRARVYVDIGWYPLGTARAARAALSGCALVVGSNSYAAHWAPGLWAVDPTNVGAVANGIGDAWAHAAARTDAIRDCSGRIAAFADPRAVLAATAQAYATAQSLRSGM